MTSTLILWPNMQDMIPAVNATNQAEILPRVKSDAALKMAYVSIRTPKTIVRQ